MKRKMVEIDKKLKGVFSRISDLAVISSLLEVSSFKPGNVTPADDFEDTSFEDFIFGAVGMRNGIYKALERGYLAAKGEIRYSKIGVGSLIRECVEQVLEMNKGKNTHLGTAMLFIPTSSAVGICFGKTVGFEKLQENFKVVIDCSTIEDAIELYRAIRICNPGGIEAKDETSIKLDVMKLSSEEKLRDLKLTFKKIMMLSAEKDLIAKEIIESLGNLLEFGLPIFERLQERLKLREAITQYYLILLSRSPDTLIARKTSLEKAKEISDIAKSILEKGGILTEEGKREIEKFDKYLRENSNKLNPGSTADLVAETIYLYLIKKEIFDKMGPEGFEPTTTRL